MAHSLSSSGVSSCYSEKDLGRYDEDESEGEENAFISFTTTESKCELLHQQGLELKQDGDLQESVSCFLRCLEGMQECQYFAKLPQTLHQLSDLYSSLNYSDEAADYAKAEKLFYEAIVEEPQATARGGGAKPKRKLFSKTPKPSNSVHNPAEYGTALAKKANEYDRLARVCAKEGKLELALEHCSKAASIRKSVFGQSHHLTVDSQDYLEVLKAMETDGSPQYHTSGSKGDLTKCNAPIDGSSLNVSCGGTLTSLSAKRSNITSQQPQYPSLNNTQALASTDSSTQTETSLHCGGNSTFLSHTRETKSQSGSGQQVVPPTNREGQECQNNNIHEASRLKAQLWDKVHEVQSWDYRTHGATYVLCQGQPEGSSHPHQEINLCTGVTNNLTKLHAPLCVNLDPHKGPGEGQEHTRCLPLWLLMLPAFLALVAYALYYH